MRCENQVAWKGISNNIISHVISVSPCHVLLYIVSLIHKGLQSKAFFSCPWEPSAASNHTGTELKDFSPSTGKYPFFPVFVFFRLSLKQQPNHTFIFPRPVRLPKAFTMDLRERPRKQQLPWQDAELNSLPLPLQQRRLQHAPRRKHFGVNRVNRVV